MDPELSVVFTSYNHKEYLRQAIDSLLNQTYQNFELIIIDDCSTDGSQEILIEYKNIDRVRLYLQEKNSGSYVKASHLGAQKAKGKYLIFAQCDDYSEANQFSSLVEAITNYDGVGVVFSRSKLVDQDGRFISNDYSIRQNSFRIKCKTDVLITGLEMRAFLSYACVIPNLSAALINKDLYFKVGGLPEEYMMAADWAFWMEMAMHSDFYYIAEPLNNFRQHSTTIRSKTKIDTQLMEIFGVFQLHIDRYNLKGKVKRDLLIGFGNIWFTYFLESPKAVGACFLNVLFKTSSRNKLMSYFLLCGMVKKIKAIFQNK